jgi:hypothetical protein
MACILAQRVRFELTNPPPPDASPHWDDDASGFGVRVTASGKLTFIVQGRVRRNWVEIRKPTGDS